MGYILYFTAQILEANYLLKRGLLIFALAFNCAWPIVIWNLIKQQDLSPVNPKYINSKMNKTIVSGYTKAIS